MKRMLLLVVLWSVCLQSDYKVAFAANRDNDFERESRNTLLQMQDQTTMQPKEASSMAWAKHLQYTVGAFGGALAGSFFVNVFDTVAARRFAGMQSAPLRETVKSIFSSYVPVAVGVVPMRAVSFGVYSLFQDLFQEHLGFTQNKILSGAFSGLSLALLTTPQEVIKTRRQIGSQIKGITLGDIKGSFVPLAARIVPTVTCMLAGTEGIQTLLSIDNIFISTALSSLTASSISQIVGTPAENIRIYRIKEKDYVTSTRDLIRKLKISSLYSGFWPRALSLGTQATFTLVSAKLAS